MLSEAGPFRPERDCDLIFQHINMTHQRNTYLLSQIYNIVVLSFQCYYQINYLLKVDSKCDFDWHRLVQNRPKHIHIKTMIFNNEILND